MYEYKRISELQVGDIVVEHGMRCLIDGEIKVSRNHGPSKDGSETRYTSALVLNPDEVKAAGVVPFHWLFDDRLDGKHGANEGEPRWTIQSNDLVNWAVEV